MTTATALVLPVNDSEQIQTFYQELGDLECQFEALKPELELTVFDRHTGMEGYVVVWNTIVDKSSPLGLVGKGGTRITPQLTLKEVKMLARTMAMKNAAAGLPMGGAKSGIRANPQAENFEATYRSFVRSVKPILRENGGKFGGLGFDLGAHPDHAIWACEEIGSTKSFTGKPVAMGGTDYDREGITGLGVATAAKTALEHDGGKPLSLTFAVQGLGAVGAAVYKHFSSYGAIPRVISDPNIGGTYLLTPWVAQELLPYITIYNFEEINKILKKSECQKRALEQVLYEEVDVLFPCAVQDVIDKNNAPKIMARYLVEGANNPCSDEARTQLYQQGITVIPDYIANPGGIIAAYVEMSSDVTPAENAETLCNVIRAKELTEERISNNVAQMMELARSLDIEPTHAGKLFALRNIFQN